MLERQNVDLFPKFRRGKNENDVMKRELIRADGDEQGKLNF